MVAFQPGRRLNPMITPSPNIQQPRTSSPFPHALDDISAPYPHTHTISQRPTSTTHHYKQHKVYLSHQYPYSLPPPKYLKIPNKISPSEHHASKPHHPKNPEKPDFHKTDIFVLCCTHTITRNDDGGVICCLVKRRICRVGRKGG